MTFGGASEAIENSAQHLPSEGFSPWRWQPPGHSAHGADPTPASPCANPAAFVSPGDRTGVAAGLSLNPALARHLLIPRGLHWLRFSSWQEAFLQGKVANRDRGTGID